MSFIYQNPLSTELIPSTLSLVRDDPKGVTFSSSLIGGYTEVWSLTDLKYTIYGNGDIEDARNIIPIRYYERYLPTIQSNQVTVNNDLISSGRRRLGQLVYVQETDTVYQYTIPNYETLWSNAYASGALLSADTSTSIIGGTSGSPNAAGVALIDAWLDSSIEGISGVTRNNARWRIFYGSDITVTGGTYTNGTASFTNTTGGTFNVTGFSTTEDTYVTGVTYSQLTKTLSIGLSDGVDITTTGFSPTITGGSFNDVSITLNNNDGTTTSITGNTTNIYNSDGVLTSNRTINQDINHITFSGSSGVSIGTGTTSAVCALLELASENQGLLLPRMTQVQRINISTPISGLLVYSTDNTADAKEGLYMYKSLGWVNIL
tara:strand:+ start:3289 stop:4416 length:1128 start_codon:yes stop_codon:yes gene_type:complete